MDFILYFSVQILCHAVSQALQLSFLICRESPTLLSLLRLYTVGDFLPHCLQLAIKQINELTLTYSTMGFCITCFFSLAYCSNWPIAFYFLWLFTKHNANAKVLHYVTCLALYCTVHVQCVANQWVVLTFRLVHTVTNCTLHYHCALHVLYTVTTWLILGIRNPKFRKLHGFKLPFFFLFCFPWIAEH